MNVYTDKTPKNKEQLPANNPIQKYGGNSSAFQFVDNRPEATAQRKLQEIINNSPQAIKTEKLQSMVDNHSVSLPKASSTIQRMVDTSAFLHTKNGQYMVNPERDQYLFSKENADTPAPTGLYHVVTDQESTSKETIKVWIPNVKFTNKTEREFMEKSEPKSPGKFLKKNFILKDETLDLTSKINGVSSVNPKKGCLPATVGAFGKNDCNIFATRLQNMIAHEKMVSQGGLNPYEPKRDVADVGTLSEEELQVGVGDKMVHMYPEAEACNYHAATIVAKDGPSTVTLEGHVSKNLEGPQFHIRNGVKGFVKDNDTRIPSRFDFSGGTSRGLGGHVNISPLESVGDPAREKKTGDQRYNIIRGTEDGFMSGDSATVIGQDLGTTDTDSPILRATVLEIAEELARVYGWGAKATNDFAKSAEGLEQARMRLNNRKKPTPSYLI